MVFMHVLAGALLVARNRLTQASVEKRGLESVRELQVRGRLNLTDTPEGYSWPHQHCSWSVCLGPWDSRLPRKEVYNSMLPPGPPSLSQLPLSAALSPLASCLAQFVFI